jgi:cyclic nucleotide gated channel
VVSTLENQGDQNLLERICDSLKPMYYEENICILKKGDRVTAMVFTTQGSVRCFKTSNDENGDDPDDHEPIDTFKLYGEELLQWLDHYPSDKQWLPNSTKTVKTHSKVEAFALTANDLGHLIPRHTRAAEATKELLQGVFQHNLIKEKNNKIFSQNG